MKLNKLITCLIFILILNSTLRSEPQEADTDPDSSEQLFSWIKLGSKPTGYIDYDGKVFDSDTLIDNGLTIFEGLADADVARIGGGSVKAMATKYYHEFYNTGEDMGLRDSGASLGMASATFKPFTVASDNLEDGTTVPCTTNIVYDGLIVLQEKQAGEYSSGQIDFSIALLDKEGDEESFVTTTTGEELCYAGQLRIEDAFDGTTHTYTDVDDMAPDIIVDLDFPDDNEENYWAGDGSQYVTIAVINTEDPSDFTVLQGSLDSVPQDIQDAIADNNYDETGNKIYYIVFDKTTTFDAVVGETYWIGMDAHAAAQTSLGDPNGWGGNETLVACDFSNTILYSMDMDNATVRTLIEISDTEVFDEDGTGTAEVSGAVLRWENNVDLDNDIELIDGATTTMNTQKYNGSVGEISGTGDLVKTGTGTLTIDDDSGISGDTTVQQGGLIVDANYTSDIIIKGGKLGGSGTIANVTVEGGMISPGNSIGTIIVDGIFGISGGTLEVEIDNSSSDKIVADSAQISSGAVQVVPLEPITATRQYTIIETEEGITGDPNNLSTEASSLSYIFNFDLDILGDDLQLTATKVHDFADIATAGVNPNISGIGRILDNAVTAGRGGTGLAALQMLNEQQLNQALGQLQPQIYQGSSNVIGQQADTVRQSTLGRINAIQFASRQADRSRWDYAMADAQNNTLGEVARASSSMDDMIDGDWVGFIRSLNDWGKVGSDRNVSGYRWKTHGVDLGAETMVDENKLVGFSISTLRSNVNGFDSSGSAEVSSLFANLYKSWFTSDWHIDAGISYGHAWTETRRPIIPLGLRANGDYESDVYGAFIGGGLVREMTDYELEPFLVYDYTLRQDGGYGENGAGVFNLNINRNDTESLLQTLGLRISRLFDSSNGTKIRAFASAAWEHQYLDDNIVSNVKLLGGTFRNRSQEIDRDSALLSGGFDWHLQNNLSIFAEYTATLNSDVTSHSLNAGMKILY